MSYIKILLTGILLVLLFMCWQLFYSNTTNVNIVEIGDRIIEVATPINVRVVK